jgi:hypothetical protein
VEILVQLSAGWYPAVVDLKVCLFEKIRVAEDVGYLEMHQFLVWSARSGDAGQALR